MYKKKIKSYEIIPLLETYKPNILVITGHDKMYKKDKIYIRWKIIKIQNTLCK